MPKADQDGSSSILVVDDDAVVRKVLAQMLQRGGYRVVEASNGKEAVAAYRRERVDLVITDLVMPEQEGIETIAQFRREHPELKLIAMSGAFGGDYLTIAGHLGAHCTLQKPLRLDVVLATVRKVLSPEFSG